MWGIIHLAAFANTVCILDSKHQNVGRYRSRRTGMERRRRESRAPPRLQVRWIGHTTLERFLISSLKKRRNRAQANAHRFSSSSNNSSSSNSKQNKVIEIMQLYLVW